MKFNVQNYLDQFIGMEVSEAFKADGLGVLVRDPYGSEDGISDSRRYGLHIPVEIDKDDKFNHKAMLTVDRTSGYSYDKTVCVIRGYRVEKILNLKELKKYSLKELDNEKN